MSETHGPMDDLPTELDPILDQFDSAWRRATNNDLRPRIEQALDGVDAGVRSACLTEMLAIELEYRCKRGDLPPIEEYLERFPSESDIIRTVFEKALAEGVFADIHRPGFGPSRFLARLNCPLCHNLIEIVTESVDSDVRCASCGSAVHLDTGRSLTWNKQHLQCIAQFELIEAVGQGAFGTVYKAFDQQLQRIVALKVPRSGVLETDEDEDRFVREARNVAQLRHPGIVAIHSVGRSDTFPYLVSEFVEGVTLSQFISAKRISARKSARLIRDISLALQHAHTQGVVHRDLKPSNIMLTNDGQPRIMDFGCAKRDAGEITMTLDGQVLGTPAYMSPEQARGLSHQADARSDVYSAGVILFQLLTGELPFRGDVRMMMLQVVHDEPPSPRKLNNQISRDLETICLKCMAKDPGRRYASAGALADDVQRYLDGTPILARPVSRMEQGWRWCRRNPVITGLASAAFTLLVTVATISTLAYVRESRLVNEKDVLLVEKDEFIAEKQHLINEKEQLALREREERERATDARLLAERKTEEVKQTVRFLQELFQSSDPLGFGGVGLRDKGHKDAELTARELLSIGIAKVNSQTEMSRQPLVRASLLDTLGNVQTSLGLYDEAEPILIEAMQTRQKMLPDDDEDLASSYLNLGLLQQFQGRFDESEKLCRQSLAIQRLRFKKDDARIATTELALAWIIAHRFGNTPSADRLQEAESLLSDAVRIRRKALGPRHRDLGFALVGLGALQVARVDTRPKGVETLQEAFSILDATDSFGIILVEYVLSVNDKHAGRFIDAIRRRRSVIERTGKILGERHPIVVLMLGDLAGVLHQAGDFDEAEKVIRQAFDLARQSPVRWHPEFARALIELGIRVRNRGENAEAKELFTEALIVSERIKDQSLIDRCRTEMNLLK